MPSVSVYLPDDVLEDVDDRRSEDQSRSDWITQALRRELNHEHDDLEGLERRIEAIEQALVSAAVYDGEPAMYLEKVDRVYGSEHDYLPTDESERPEDGTGSDG